MRMQRAGCAAPAPHDAASRASVPARQVRGFDPTTSRELPGRRRANQRVFANADGTRTTQFSASPVNYRRPDGSWAPLDPELEPAGTAGAGWRNTADATGLRLAGRADAAALARISVDSARSVAFGLFGAREVTGRADGDTVTYPGVLPGVDLRLTSQASGVKETLVLSSADAPRRSCSRWRWPACPRPLWTDRCCWSARPGAAGGVPGRIDD